MQTILTVLQVFLSLGLIGLVLIQHGRGADAGAAFGAGASGTVFGARGAGSFLSRATAVIATLFFLTSMALAYYAAKGGRPAGLMDAVDGVQVKTPAPAQAPKGGPVPVGAPSEVPVVPGVVAPSATSDVPTLPVAPVKAIQPPAAGAADIPVVPVRVPESDRASDGASEKQSGTASAPAPKQASEQSPTKDPAAAPQPPAN